MVLVKAPFPVGFFIATLTRGINYPIVYQILDYYGKPLANQVVKITTSILHIPPEYYSLYLKYGDDYFISLEYGNYLTTNEDGILSY